MLEERLIALGYIAMRLAPLLLVTPLFFLTYIPLLVRTMMTMVITIIISFGLNEANLSTVGSSFDILKLLGEFFIGLVLALAFHAVSAALHMMSQLVDIQMGISAGATFDPQNYQTNSPTGKLLSLIAIAIFFTSNLHYQFFLGLSEVFRVVPIGAEIGITSEYLAAISKIFVLAFVLAGPVIIVLFLTDVSLALISRSMPQAQVYFVALPLKILIGFLMLALMLSLSYPYFYKMLSAAIFSWDYLRVQ